MRTARWMLWLVLAVAVAGPWTTSHALIATQPAQPRPMPSYGIHKLVLTHDGMLYLRMETPVGKPDPTPSWDLAATLDLAQLFPTRQSFGAFAAMTPSQKEAALAAAGSVVKWDETDLAPGDVVAEATILLDLNEPDDTVLQAQFEDHVGAMVEAWSTVLRYPFSAGAERGQSPLVSPQRVLSPMLLLEAPLGLGRGASQPAWGQVGEWVGQVPSSAWAAGKFIATKLLPIGQTIESCIQIAEAIADLIEQHQPPKWEYLGGLCGEECEGDEAAAQAAWCWLEW